MATRTIFRVRYDRKGEFPWKLVEGTAYLAGFVTKKAAIKEGSQRGRNFKLSRLLAQLVVHNRDGTIEREYTYGRDPRRRKG